MTHGKTRDQAHPKPSSDLQSDPDWVGYKRPPKHTQFVAGKSGNPKGRPKKKSVTDRLTREDLKDIFRTEITRKSRVQERGKVFEMAAIQVAIRSQVLKAQKGDLPSTRFLLQMIDELELPRPEVRKIEFEDVPVGTPLAIEGDT